MVRNYVDQRFAMAFLLKNTGRAKKFGIGMNGPTKTLGSYCLRCQEHKWSGVVQTECEQDWSPNAVEWIATRSARRLSHGGEQKNALMMVKKRSGGRSTVCLVLWAS